MAAIARFGTESCLTAAHPLPFIAAGDTITNATAESGPVADCLLLGTANEKRTYRQ